MGEVGKRSVEEANLAMGNGAIDIPNPAYGYLVGSQLMRGKMGSDIYNGRIRNDVGEMIYVDRFGGNRREKASMCQVGGCACRGHMKYKRGSSRREMSYMVERAAYPITENRETTEARNRRCRIWRAVAAAK